jgi:UDP:flavonoid glycosyltransferase YjiC (YdhE family)
MRNILIVAKGSYGDVFPLYALALKLRERGHQITFATELKHQRVTLSLGFPVVILDKPGQGNSSRVFTQVHYHFSSENLCFEAATLLKAGATSDIILGNQIAHFGALVAKKLGKCWIYCPVSPLALPSRHDLILFPYLQHFQRLTIQYPQLQGLYLSLAREASRLMMRPVANQRRLLDQTDRLHPQFEGMYSSDLNLLLTSPLLAEKQRDWPASTRITGFTWFEADFLKSDEKTQRIERFLDAGAPPVVFALAAAARSTPGSFFHTSVKVCNMLGVRAIIVASAKFHSELNGSDHVLITDYIPYSSLFPRVQAVVHSGGIGTIGWCLKFGIPSLLLPTHVDQFNNSYRAASSGFADVMFGTNHSTIKMARSLSALIDDEKKHRALKAIAGIVAKEDGAQVACDSIEKLC